MSSPALPESAVVRSSGGRRLRVTDSVYTRSLQVVALLFLALMVAFLTTMVLQSRSAFQHFGLGFITGQTWDPVHAHFGVLVFIAVSYTHLDVYKRQP